jgi:hypothetical protein
VKDPFNQGKTENNMQNWKVCGSTPNGAVAVFIQAQSRTAAIEISSKAPYLLLVVRSAELRTEEDVWHIATSRLCQQHGWRAECALDNVVMKDYAGAAGFPAALASIRYDSKTAHFNMSCSYTVEDGHGDRSQLLAIPETASKEEIESFVDAFALKADTFVHASAATAPA